jgi:hypothetical protein
MIPLHGGHQHTEAASTTLGTEFLVISVVGFLIGAALIGYAVNQYLAQQTDAS